jgi:hypothetical protein
MKSMCSRVTRFPLRAQRRPAASLPRRIFCPRLDATPRFFLGPPGQRTDFRLLARLLDFPHLSLASRVEAEVFFGQPPGRLTPMALAFYEFDRFPVVAASALMNAPALGFAIGGGTRVWLSPDALCELVAALGFSFQILDNANEIPEMALSHPEDSRGSATRRSPTSS